MSDLAMAERGLGDALKVERTMHPSLLLRMPDPTRRREERARYVEDLVRIRKRVAKLAA
jgi:DNA polymerase